MKRYRLLAIATAMVVAMTGCGSMQKEKAKSYKEWHQARSRIVCSVGEEHFKAGTLDKAQSCAMESLSLDSNYLPARMLLAKVLLGRGCYQEACEQLLKIELSSLDNENGSSVASIRADEVAYLRGEAMERLGKYPEALQCYQKARVLNPSNDAYVMASAEVMVSMGQLRGALELLEVHLQRIGADIEPSMLVLAGEVAMLAEDYAKASGFFRQRMDMVKGQNAEGSGRFVLESLSKACFFAGDYKGAIESLKRIPNDSGQSSCWALIMMGDSYMALNRPGDAKSAYESAIEIEPGDWPVWLSLAKAAVADGDARRGVTAGLRAMELARDSATTGVTDKRRVDVSVITACAMLMDNRPEDAMKILATSAKDNPEDPMLWCMLGRCYSAMNRSDRAASCYMTALRLEPENHLARSLLACIGTDQQETAKAQNR